MTDFQKTLLAIFYNLVILGGTSYIVFGMDYSGWWFLLAVILLASIKDKNKFLEDA